MAENNYSLQLSSGSVSTPGTQVVTIVNGAGRPAVIRVIYHETTLFTDAGTTGQFTIPVTKDWFDDAGVTTAKSFTATVTVTVLTGSSSIQLNSTFTVEAGQDMAPEISWMTRVINFKSLTGLYPVQTQNAASYLDFAAVFISGISKATGAVFVTAPTDAAITQVTLSFFGAEEDIQMTYNSGGDYWEATTAGALNKDLTYAATAVDERGMSTTTPVREISLTPYNPPTVMIDGEDTFRCNSAGIKSDTGGYYKAKADAVYAGLTGNSLLAFSVRREGLAGETNLTSGVQSAAIDGQMNQGLSYNLIFTIEDKVSSAREYAFNLKAPVRSVSVHHNSTGTNVGVGGVPTASSGSTIELPAGGKFMINGVSLLDIFYPVGSLYMSADSANPSTFMGGTWTAVEDVFILGASASHAAGSTGGAETVTLTVAELPAHNHGLKLVSSAVGSGSNYARVSTTGTDNTQIISSTGGGDAHNNMPPFKAYYIWERTA